MVRTKQPSLTGLLRFAVVAAALCAPAASAPAQDSTPRPYLVHWTATSGIPAPGQRWRDWQAEMNFGDAPIHRDFQIFYEWNMGVFPYAGLHIVEADPDYMSRHLAAVRRTVQQQFPDANATGYGAIDYEEWTPAWDFQYNEPSNLGPTARDMDFKDDWRDYIRAQRPSLLAGRTPQQEEQVFHDTYNDAGRRFFLATLNECKRLRPGVKWGFYCFPTRSYHDYQTPTRAAAFKAKDRRELQWLYDEQDAFFPDVYTLYYTVPSNPDYRDFQDSDAENQTYIEANIRHAREIAGNRPVIAYIWPRYHVNVRNRSGQLVNELNLRNMLEVPKRAGADGVAIWENFSSDSGFTEIQTFFTQRMARAINSVATDYQASPPPAPPTPQPPPPTPPAPTPPPPPEPTPGTNGSPGASGNPNPPPGATPPVPPVPPVPPPQPQGTNPDPTPPPADPGAGGDPDPSGPLVIDIRVRRKPGRSPIPPRYVASRTPPRAAPRPVTSGGMSRMVTPNQPVAPTALLGPNDRRAVQSSIQRAMLGRRGTALGARTAGAPSPGDMP